MAHQKNWRKCYKRLSREGNIAAKGASWSNWRGATTGEKGLFQIISIDVSDEYDEIDSLAKSDFDDSTQGGNTVKSGACIAQRGWAAVDMFECFFLKMQ